MEPEIHVPHLDSERLKALGYGLEAIKRLRAGRSIIYSEGDIIVEEFPDGRRMQVDIDDALEPIVIGPLPSVSRD